MEIQDETKASFIISLIGNTKAGKTCLLKRYVENEFSQDTLSTIGTEKFSKIITIKKTEKNIEKEIPIKLDFFDTTGQERFLSLSPKFFKNAHSVIFVIDLYSENDLNLLNHWIKILQDNIKIKCVVIYCGSKIDLENTQKRYFFKENYEELNKKLKGYYFETSSKNNEGIEEMMNFISQEVYKNFYDDIINTKNHQILLQKTQKNKKNCCLH